MTDLETGCVIDAQISDKDSDTGHAQTKWRHVYNWSAALLALRIHFGDRIPDTAT